MNKLVLTFLYILVAGLLPTILLYIIDLKILAITEATSFELYVAFFTLISGILASIYGAWLFFMCNLNYACIEYRDLVIELILITIGLEVYIYINDPLWQVMPLIVIAQIGVGLAFSLFLVKKKSS